MGRPALPKGEKREKKITIYLFDEEEAELWRLARVERRSLADFIRLALEKALPTFRKLDRPGKSGRP